MMDSSAWPRRAAQGQQDEQEAAGRWEIMHAKAIDCSAMQPWRGFLVSKRLSAYLTASRGGLISSQLRTLRAAPKPSPRKNGPIPLARNSKT